LDNGTTPTTKKVEKGQKLTGVANPTKDGYIFKGWKANGADWSMETAITADITIVAQWEKDEQIDPTIETITIHFDSNGGSSIANCKVEKNKPMSQPLDPERPGYEFTGWYTSNNQKWDFNQKVTEEMTLVAQWKELKYTISFNNNGHCSTTFTDRLESFVPDDLPTLSDSAYLFAGWYLDADGNDKVVVGDKLTDNITLYAKWITSDDINIIVASGHLESAYLEWSKQQTINDYNVYYKAKGDLDSAYVKIDKPLIREYATYYRADILGLAAGDYTLKVESIVNNGVGMSATRNVSVIAHERSGFAFSQNSKYKTASGAYNDDGTLKSDAEVIYVTAKNAKTVTCTIDGTEFTGIQAILTAKQKGSTKPLAVRMIGLITVDDLDSCGSSAEGLQVKGKNAFAEMNVTIEGVGEDATIYGFGFLIRNCGNVEIRNFGIMNQMDDGISIDTDNCNIWVHNLDIYYGKKGSGDKAKGDGSVDTKQSTNVTISYNHFWDSGKCNLQGMKSETTSNCITYHHNWYDHSDSRHPRIRTCTVHIYNNYFDGNAKYGVGMTSGGSAFVENNFFRNCKNPMMISLQGTDALGAKGTFSGESGGIIKAYGNHIEGDSDTKVISYAENNTSFDAYVASSRDEKVPSTVKALSGGTTYNNFDTDSSIMYTYSVDTPEVAKTKVTTYAGRINGGDLKWNFDNATQDRNYDIIPELSNAVLNYKSSLVRVLGM
ncbi:MAG: InlB B-repeat-containing protein, partial [Anaeroplasmataceae bacterium]|nr:InlB B-repeat-containing protein [Anaeroplasmataceae bacterium]